MPKQCNSTGCTNNVFSNGYCQRHQYMRTDKKWLATKAKPGKVRSAINRISAKQKVKEKDYNTISRLYKIANPYCKALLRGCQRHTSDIHHKAGRGENLLLISTFLPVCRSCHNWIEEHPKESIELGFSISRFNIQNNETDKIQS